jgi:hypothetical protein
MGWPGQRQETLNKAAKIKLPPVRHNLKPKDLVGIPWRVAFALQADGWYLRSDIIWSKPNPMPESVTDRPTKAHEYVFLLTKSARYFYDADAVREGLAESTASDPRMKDMGRVYGGKGRGAYGEEGPANGSMQAWSLNPAGRNRRTVWNIATAPYSGAHFATYPPALVEPCIKAGTSERGCCPTCGKAWERVVERERPPASVYTGKRKPDDIAAVSHPQLGKAGMGQKLQNWYVEHPITTTGWQPACTCPPADPIPCVVFDPFAGSGTTLLVARKLGRHGVGLDLSYAYLHDQARQRLNMTALAEWETGRAAGDNNYHDLPLFEATP